MTTIERLRKAKLEPLWLRWAMIVCAVGFFAMLLMDLDKPRLSVLNAVCFSTFLLAYHDICQKRTVKELLQEIDALRQQLGPR